MMGKKIYSSYEEIDQDIQILKLEKDVSYQKLILSLETTKEHLKPKLFSNSTFSLFMGVLWKPIQNIAVSYIIKKCFGR